MAKDKYSDDYKLVHTVDDKGRQRTHAEYNGDYYAVSLEEYELRQLKRNSLLLLVVLVALHVAAGFLNNQGMYQFYIALPYAAGFFPLFFLAESIFRLPVEKRAYKREEVEQSFVRVKSTGKTLLLFLAVVLVGEALYFVFGAAPENRILEAGFFFAEAFAAGFLYFLTRIQNPIEIEILDKN